MPGIAHLALDSEQDLLTAREIARRVAAALGFTALDQARIALAATDLAATDLAATDLATTDLVTTDLDVAAGPNSGALDIAVSDPPDAELVIAVQAGRRPGARPARFPLPPDGPGPGELDALRARAAAPAPTVQDLRAQDASVVDAFEQLAARQDDLDRLSGELEMTNRGVVALYAELDERGLQLREANRAKSRFLASVSHELRSPLNSVVALTQLLREPDSEPLTAGQAHQIRLIAQSAGQLLTLVNGLLDLARAESGNLHPALDTVDLPALFAELRSTLRPITPDAVDLVFSTPRVQVVTDPVLLAQVLRNLVSNAIKFTEHGRVTVSASLEAGGSMRVAVTDTGVGIAPEHQPLVFEEFFQVPGPLQVGHRGSGLGLPYSRRVLEALGSALTLASRPGAGSTFTFTLPLADSSADAPDADPPDAASSGAASSGAAPLGPAPALAAVLIADDEAPFRAALRAALDGVCEEVRETTDATTTIAALTSDPPDLLLLDLRMPGGGEAVLDWLAGHPALHSLPVVLVTSLPLAEINGIRSAAGRPVLDKSDLSSRSVAALMNVALRKAGP